MANVIILPMAFLGGAFIPLNYAPAWINGVSYAMPLRYLVVGMQDVMARGEGPASALPAIGILLGIAAVLTVDRGPRVPLGRGVTAAVTGQFTQFHGAVGHCGSFPSLWRRTLTTVGCARPSRGRCAGNIWLARAR